MKIVRLDDIEPAPLGESLWKPIRSTLGVQAFGINAYVASSAGDRLFDEHDETEAGAGRQRHEELYLVLAGRAAFTGQGAEIDAPTGTLVFFDDPAERRSARAAEADTTILAIGGPVGEPYEVAPWEYWFRARAAQRRRNPDEARAIAAEGLARHPDDATLRRLAAD